MKKSIAILGMAAALVVGGAAGSAIAVNTIEPEIQRIETIEEIPGEDVIYEVTPESCIITLDTMGEVLLSMARYADILPMVAEAGSNPTQANTDALEIEISDITDDISSRKAELGDNPQQCRDAAE